MAELIRVKEMAQIWKLSERSITRLCRNGRIPGAVKDGRTWSIPSDAAYPFRGATKQNAYKTGKQRLPLPVGVSDYRVASTEYYYVDKTAMIKEFLDERPMVSLFTRPRRFGKTLNMDMLKTFFEISDEDTSVYFRNKAIWKCGKAYQEHQGRYPVVFVTFKDIKCETWPETLKKLSETISNEYARHRELENSPVCDERDKAYYRRLMDDKADATELSSAFMVLTKMLHAHYGTPAVVIVDEYDTPIQQGHTYGFYEQVVLFMRNLFSGAFKDNRHLSYGFLTGILRVAKEGIFSGLNNLAVNTVLDDPYSAQFGFTEDEIRQMAAYYGAEDRIENLKDWYDGYFFGNTEIYNPWSVVNFFRNRCETGAYWQATGNNEIIGEVLAEAGSEIYDELQGLLEGKQFLTFIDTDVVYPEIKNNPSSVFSFLLMAGYLKSASRRTRYATGYMCSIAIPNKEISFVYQKEILEQLGHVLPRSFASSIQEALFAGDVEKLREQLRKLLMETVSTFDTANESFYQGLVLGLCAIMGNGYYVRSNRESGEGRFDIQISPTDVKMPGIIIELKSLQGKSNESLEVLAQAALQQIEKKHYDTEMRAHGVTNILKYGVAFHGKDVEIALI